MFDVVVTGQAEDGFTVEFTRCESKRQYFAGNVERDLLCATIASELTKAHALPVTTIPQTPSNRSAASLPIREERPLRISSMSLGNYRVFGALDIDFHPRLTVLTGRNGCGKTTLLRAVHMAGDGPEYMSFIGPRVSVDDNGEQRPVFPTSADVTFSDAEYNYSWTKDENDKVDFEPHDAGNKPPWTEPDTPFDKFSMIASPVFSLPENGDELAVAAELASHFLSHFGCEVEVIEKSAGNDAQGNGSGVTRPKITVLDNNGTRHDLYKLGDGLHGIASLGLALASMTVATNRAAEVNDLASPAQFVACIDDIELHLHPSWQQRIIPALLDTFPETQFVVATHSQMVLSTVYAENIRCIEIFEDGTASAFSPVEEVIGLHSDTVLAKVLKTMPVPDTEQRKIINEYIELIEAGSGDTQEAAEVMSKIIEVYGKNHPVVIDLERHKLFQEIKARLKNG